MVQMKNRNDNIVSCMAQTPLFVGLPENVCLALASELAVYIKAYGAAEMVCHECNPASRIVSVLSGRLLVYQCGLGDADRHLVCTLCAGEAYGITFPALNFRMNPGMLVAAEETRVLVCDVARVRQLIQEGRCKAVITNLYVAAARQGFNAWRKVALLGCYRISDRVLLHLQRRYDAGDRSAVSVAELAAYLGVNRTAFYHAVAKLQKAGRVVVVGGKVSLVAGAVAHHRRADIPFP